MSTVSGRGKMDGWCMNKMKSWLLILVIIVMMVSGIEGEGGCIEEERKALLEIKTSLIHSYVVDVDHFLPSWVEDGGECCDWERVMCDTTTGHVTNLSLSNMIDECIKRIWPLNVSVFLHFKELTSLDLSENCLDSGIVNTGLGRLSSLKKLKTLDLSENYITYVTFPSLGALTSLRVLHLSDNYDLKGYFHALALENLAILDLAGNNMEGFEQISLLKKLEILILRVNKFNKSFITSLNALPMLKSLDLSYNNLGGSFPAKELVHLTNLEELDLTENSLYGTPSIQECMRLSRLKKLKSITLQDNDFNTSIISCLSDLPSLKTLDLTRGLMKKSFPIQELSDSRLEVLLLSDNDLNGTLEAFTSFHHLEVLDLSWNNFVGSIPSTINALSTIRVVSFAHNMLNGSLLGLCELKNLHELDLSHNMFDGNLPQCFNRLSSLKVLDISSNQITGTIPPSLTANLTSLEYVDFSDNKFEGAFSFSSFSSHTKLEVVSFRGNNDKFEMETEEPMGWIPMFQLKVLEISGCNINRLKGSVVPGFLLHQHMLRMIDLSHNSLVGQFPNRLIENNTKLEALILRNNSFGGTICMPLHTNANLTWLDMSEIHMIGSIPGDIQKFFPYIMNLNLSMNFLNGSIPSSIGDMSQLGELDLSDNELSGEVPKGL